MSDELSTARDGSVPFPAASVGASAPLPALPKAASPMKLSAWFEQPAVVAARPWLLILLPYLLAWWFPILWCTSNWFNTASLLSFQPLIPFGAVLLIWVQRAELRQIYTELQLLFTPEHSRRRGDSRIIVIGCLLLLFAHLAHLPSVAVFSLIVILVGVIRRFFGLAMLKMLWVPLSFLLLMIPPPDTVTTVVSGVFRYGSAQAAGIVTGLFVPGVRAAGMTVPLPDHLLDVGDILGGANIVFPTMVITTWLLLMVRGNSIAAAMLILLSAVIALILNTIRLVLMAVLGGRYPWLNDFLGTLNPWMLTAASIYITYSIGRAIRFGGRE